MKKIMVCAGVCLMLAATSVQATVITNARRIVGTTPGQPGIVAGPSPGGLQEGSHAFMDRPLNSGDTRNYHWKYIPDELIGADYVMTYNEDKQPVYGSAYDVSYSVTVRQPATLYIFIDRRYVDAHGASPFDWLTDGSSGAVFRDTGLEIMLNEVGGRNVLQPYFVYAADVPAGSYTLGATCDGNSNRSFYAIAAKRIQTAVITDATRIVGTTAGQPEIVAGPSPAGLQEGSHAFVDRPLNPDDTRNYHWENIPDELVGADYVMTYNEDKRPEYDNAYDVSYSVTVRQAATLYIFIDRRYADAYGDPPFAWLIDGSRGAVFKDTGLDIMLNEVGGRNVLQPFDVYAADVSAGTYTLGATCDGNGNRAFYTIAAQRIQAAIITSAERIDGITEGQPEIVGGPSPGGLQEGSHAFKDRPSDPGDTRNYHWEDIPAVLLGADYVMTYNDDKLPWEYSYPIWPYDVKYSVTLAQPAMLYIFVDYRYVDEHGDPPFDWLTDGSGGAVFTDTGLEIMLNEVGGRNVLQPFVVYAADVLAGVYILGATCDESNSRDFYGIAAAY